MTRLEHQAEQRFNEKVEQLRRDFERQFEAAIFHQMAVEAFLRRAEICPLCGNPKFLGMDLLMHGPAYLLPPDPCTSCRPVAMNEET